MAAITAKMVSDLRAKTGVGMMECKKALTEADGNEEEAIKILREKGLAVADKKSSRIAAEGIVDIMFDEATKTAAMIEVNIETDFAAKNPDFRKFVSNVAEHIENNKPANIEELLAQNFEADKTVQQSLTELIATIGENTTLRRFIQFTGSENTYVESYIHGDGKIAVLVDFKAGTTELAKDVCMQIAAAKPEYLNRQEVPADVVAKEMEILKAQAMNDGKPAEIAEKMVNGRIGKFYGEICLLEQEFVKDPSMKVEQLLKSNNSEITKFARFEKGEGIEKKEENFAEEVMKQIK